MSRKRDWLQLPVHQHWSCHGTGRCCRDHVIEITREEKDRILAQGWDDVPEMSGVRLVERAGRNSDGTPRFRLAHRADGRCVFLDDEGLCRIHRKFGLQAKPLACQIYPYVYVPLGSLVRVGLRFSCPSVVADRGDDLESQRSELARMGAAVTDGGLLPEPPELAGGIPVPSWEWLVAYLDCASRFFVASPVDARLQCLRLLAWHGLVLTTLVERKGAAADWLDACAIQAIQRVDEAAVQVARPGRLARLIVRTLAARLGRRDRVTDRGLWATLTRGWRTVRIAVGVGRLPAMAAFNSVPRRALCRVAPVPQEEANRVLLRYMRIKLWSGQFCGVANNGLSVHDGLLALTTAFVVILWLARWHAAARGETCPDVAAVAEAIQAVDHHFGYDPILTSRLACFRYRWLWNTGEIVRLVACGGDCVEEAGAVPAPTSAGAA